MKKFMVVLMALVMVLSLSLTVMAQDVEVEGSIGSGAADKFVTITEDGPTATVEVVGTVTSTWTTGKAGKEKTHVVVESFVDEVTVELEANYHHTKENQLLNYSYETTITIETSNSSKKTTSVTGVETNLKKK